MCGILSIYTEDLLDIKALAYYGMIGLQHRGQEACGLSFVSNMSSKTIKSNASNIFKVEGNVERLFRHIDIEVGNVNTIVLTHIRYATTGESTINNAQPFSINNTLGSLNLVHNGNLTNTNELRLLCIKYKLTPNSNTDSELILLLINYYWAKNKSLENAIIKTVNLCKGAFSLIISTQDVMYVYRDKHGVRPLVYGIYKEDDKIAHIIASETCALDNIGATYIKDIPLGTLISFSKNKYFNIVHAEEEINKKFCIFESIYFSRPDSIVNNESLYEYRFRLGQILATKLPVEADLVVGTPDSGLISALGYSHASSVPYGDALIKNRYIGRTFIQPTQTMRQQGIKLKLNPIPFILQDKIVILIDDSIVRGNTSKLIIKSIREAGAKEIHLRISSPPIYNACNLGMDFPDSTKLVAHNKTIKEIAEFIGADSLAYLSVEDILNASKENNTNFCTGCFNNKYLT